MYFSNKFCNKTERNILVLLNYIYIKSNYFKYYLLLFYFSIVAEDHKFSEMAILTGNHTMELKDCIGEGLTEMVIALVA